MQWGSSGASRCKMRWGGGWTARADVDVGVFMRGYFCACDEAAGAGPREGYVAALRRRCDGETRVFGAARATLTHKISILALCGQLAFQRPGQRTKRNTKCPSPRCKLDAIPEHFNSLYASEQHSVRVTCRKKVLDCAHVRTCSCIESSQCLEFS